MGRSGDCVCEAAGWCERYKRSMTGQLYEACGDRCTAERPATPGRLAYYAEIRKHLRELAARPPAGFLPAEDPPEPTRPESYYPSAAEMAAGAAAELLKWIAAGRPRRSDEECRRIHLVCENCPGGQYDRAEDRCRRCGCALSEDSSASWVLWIGIPDAIRMATKHCPDGHW